MRDIELYSPDEGAEADLQRLAKLLFEAAGAAIDEDKQETTRLLIGGRPMAVIAPYEPDRLRGVQIGHGNVQSNTFG